MINSKNIKKMVNQKGAEICRIAPVSRFENAPEGFHPQNIYPDCRSVIVFASHFPLSTLRSITNSPYTFVRHKMVDKLDNISFCLSDELERYNILSIPIPSAAPYDYWDSDRRHGRGILSLKHAGALSGLGVIGKNTLLINDRYGNMIWLGAVLVSVDLEPDPISSREVCKKCTVCIDSCPQKALDGTNFDQKLCREASVSSTEGGGWVLSCNICRKICPYHAGIKKAPSGSVKVD